MTTTYYASITADVSTLSKDVDNAGTSSTATDIIEVRMGNGSYAPTRHEVIKGLERIIRWLVEGGLKGQGANIPVNTGPN